MFIWNNWQITLGIFLTFFVTCSTTALSPKFEADRLVLLAEELINEKQFSNAQETLDRVKSLTTQYPDNFYYLSAVIFEHETNYAAAAKMMENYVEQAGDSAPRYRTALEKITFYRSKTVPTNRSPQVSTGSAITWSEPNNQDDYLSNIQYLYQLSEPKTALLSHINNLLDFYGYGDKDITASNRINETSRFSLSVTPPAHLVTTKRQIHPTSEHTTSTRISVYGINPYVSYRCRNSDNSCVINHPINNKSWLKIVNNDEAAQEISKAVAELIKLLQSQS